MRQLSKLRWVFCILLIAISVNSLTGCSLSGTSSGSDPDIPKILDSYLKALTKQEYEDYARYTDSTAEESKNDCEEFIENFMEGIVGYEMDDTMKKSYCDLFKKILAQSRYEIGEATDNGNNTYTISVTLHTLNLFTVALEKANNDYLDALIKAKKDVSQDEATKMFLEYALKYSEAELKNPSYAEPETITVTMAGTADNPNIYDISEDDLGNLLGYMVDFYAWAVDSESDDAAAEELE